MSRPLTIRDLPREERFAPGHRMCQGCGAAILMRHITKAVPKDTIITQATGCVEVTTTLYPETAWKHPWIHVAFENAAAVASGVEAALKALKRKGVIPESKDVKVLSMGGDGGTFDIGIQALSGMLERGHDVLYIVYDNEAYMNTGIQRSGATPFGAWTTTTPVGKVWRGEWRRKKDIISIALAHRVPYVATVNPAFLPDLYEKIRKALSIKGPKLIHAFSPCVPGWRYEPELTIAIAKMAVFTGVWVNYEVENGEFRVTTPVPKRKPVEEYLKLQGRFRHLTAQEISEIQKYVDEQVEHINKLAGKVVIGPVER
ncbi:MAG: pyruvate ferredoxin oxidoreductase [Zestosphaera tikiterensis]|uniref:2-oxoacid oxidoreductase (ferredoxin) n=1 Tax=Zestosphaera tikiterensis TaxID=1973259 RepID=A0A2R7Y6E4_9CREN|nr:MAG: pyruvate ferredoxin oxidoreductase [Zestosphaera tikiterensis]